MQIIVNNKTNLKSGPNDPTESRRALARVPEGWSVLLTLGRRSLRVKP